MNIKKQNFFLAVLLIVELLMGCWHSCFAMHQVPCQKCNGLFDTILSGDLEKVKILLNTPGLDLNGSWPNGFTPLHQACSWYCCPPEIVELLLNRGAHVNRLDIWGRTPLHRAARDGSLATVQLLLERGAEVYVVDIGGETPLMNADYNRYEADAIKKCINDHIIRSLRTSCRTSSSIGSCPEQREEACRVTKTGLHIARRRQRCAEDAPSPSAAAAAMQQSAAAQSSVAASSIQQIPSRCVQAEISERVALERLRLDLEKGVDVNLQDCCGRTKLHEAVQNSRQSVVQFLLEHGAEVDLPDNEGLTPLHCAARYSCLEIVQFLLDHGAEVNAPNCNGFTPLMYASIGSHPRVIQLLLDRGAKADMPDKKEILPLHIASMYGHIAAVKMFLDCGINVNKQTSSGETPLHLAILENRQAVVKLLLENGADVNIASYCGDTALDLAVKRQFKEVAQIIQDHIECLETKCPICLRYAREFGSSERAQTPCCHQFICLSDLRNVRAHNHSCPLCRERKGWE